MDISLHIGAHRTATTTFQHYMRQNAPALRRDGVGFWGPLRTRAGLLSDILPASGGSDAALNIARDRIARALDRAERDGTRHLIVSEENIAGLPAHNIRTTRLYPRAGERLARIARAFDHRVTRIVLTIRPQQDYWASAIAYAVHRGHPMPAQAQLARIARGTRGWRDMVTDIAAGQAGQVHVLPFGTPPQAALTDMTDGTIAAPGDHAGHHLNTAPDRADLRAALDARGVDSSAIPAGEGRWQPFDADQRAMLDEAWQDDEFWLAAGAGGLSAVRLGTGLTQGTKHQPERAGYHLPPGLLGRGHGHDIEERRLVGSR